MEKGDFTKGIERLVNPIDVGTIHFIQHYNKFVPKWIQQKMVQSSGKKTPYMGFVVEPYSFFLCYEIKDLLEAQSLLPEGFRLLRTRIFEDDTPKYYCILGCFTSHTSAFWGSRVEFYIIAENIATGLLCWIIVDYDTNTITYDPKNSLSDPNVLSSVITTDYNGILWIDVQNKHGRQLVLNSTLSKGIMTPLDKRLWIEGNLSIAYGNHKSENHAGLFSLIFDQKEFSQALRISHDAVSIHTNDWFPTLRENTPSQIVCFPYAQHLLSDSPGHSSYLKTPLELEKAMEEIDFSKISSFSTSHFKACFIYGGFLSSLLNMLLLYLLFFG